MLPKIRRMISVQRFKVHIKSDTLIREFCDLQG